MKRRLKIFSKYMIFFLCALGTFACGRENQQDPGRAELEFLSNVLLFQHFNSGNCLVSRRSGTEMGTLKCSRANRSQCDIERLYDATGGLVTTVETQNRFRSEIASLLGDYPVCKTASLLALTQPAFIADDTTAVSTSRTENVLQVIDSCDSLNNSNAGKLATNAQFTALTSARGVLAQQARFLGQTDCLNALYGSGTDQTLIENLASGDLVLEVSCLYGAGWSFPFSQTCTTEEKAAANIFDFTMSF